MPEMERLMRRQDRLRAQRKRKMEQKRARKLKKRGYAQETTMVAETERSLEREQALKWRRRRGWKVVEMSKIFSEQYQDSSLPLEKDNIGRRRKAKDSRWAEKWDKRIAKMDRRARR